jgi:glutathione synthase/RimK-type ligase-like ATP-grasp enzyme
MSLTVVGNPDNRRVALFRAAARAAGVDEPHVIAWRDVACGQSIAIPDGALVRIDSPGEDAEVDRLIRRAARPAEHGEIVGLADWYDGFGRALTRVAEAADAARARLLNDPADILVMFDKRACHARLAMAGVPVPPALPSPSSYAELRRAMARRGWRRVFVKPAHGSSSSGVLALQTDGHERVRADTSVELVGHRLFNNLRVRTYRSEAQIASIVDLLAPGGLHVERWFPKAGLAGRTIDLRVVVVAGRATHAVVRASRSPMTNLHLGNRRGDLATLRSAAGAGYDAAIASCERVAACFPGSLQVGVDVMFSPDFHRHAIAEVNAFGDLLPGLLNDGRDTYAQQIEVLLCRLT